MHMNRIVLALTATAFMIAVGCSSSRGAIRQNALAEKDKEIAALNAAHDALTAAMRNEIERGEINIKRLDDMLDIDFKDDIFFDSGSVEVKEYGKAALIKFAAVMKSVTDKQIRVEGFTDNVPTDEVKKKFPSNWELSTARASAIVRYLQSIGIDPRKMKATGYGEYNPWSSNDTETGRAQNRKIVILLVPLDERTRYR